MRRFSHLLAPTVAVCAALVACSGTTDPGGLHPDAEAPDTGSACPACDAGPPDTGSGDAPVSPEDADASACNSDPSFFSMTGSGSVHYVPTVCDGGAYAWTNPPIGDAGSDTWLRLVFADTSNVCGKGIVRASSKQIWIDAEAQSGSLTPRVYPIKPGGGTNAANASIIVRNALCDDSGGHTAIGGTLEVTSASSTKVAGTFSLEFADGTLTGSFDVPICGGPDNMGGACVP